MNIYNLLKIAYKALVRNKTRAGLTMLGIIIGIASVIAMVSLGQSSSLSINEQISQTGTNMVMVLRSFQVQGGVNIGSGSIQTLVVKDAEAIKERVPHVEFVSPVVQSSGQLVYGANNWPGSIQGGDVPYFTIRKYEVDRGTPYTEEDVRTAAKVCLLGQTVIDNLFPNGEEPLGKTVRFGNIPFKVIGTLVAKGQNAMGQDQDDIILAPYTTVQKRILAITFIHSIIISADDESNVQNVMDNVTTLMRSQHKIREGNQDDFNVRSQQQMLQMMDSITGFLTILLAAIASISLIVGGIGIMNIMYVTVTERTKEIGLRMAIGAKNRDILLQFLTESTILSLIGGIIGILLGLCLSFLASNLLHWPFIISIPAVGGSFFVCAATGIFFGWYPAKKAASLDPINALRYE
ncbi:MAG: ABC transporter permease [Candidatus Azobacteroides sp.]|nr:ABC transporter permease [Candidatus Azobacteroides sp.]